jgi:hypothetical protein
MMTIKELRKAGFMLANSYGSRQTAESVADKYRDMGWDTAIREDKWGNHNLYRRPVGVVRPKS